MIKSPAEIDEVHFGGLEKNKHTGRKRPGSQGSFGKMAVVGIKDRATNRISVWPVPETTKVRFEGFVEEHADDGAKKHTDENKAYTDLPNHESVKCLVGEYVRGQAHVNGMESFWAMMHRGYDGTFRHIWGEHLHRYVNEFAGRHNIRDCGTADMMGIVAGNMVGQRLMCSELIATNSPAGL